jgi:hypothetical protein
MVGDALVTGLSDHSEEPVNSITVGNFWIM